MKQFLFIAIAALVAGGVYHEEVSDYFGEFTVGSGGGSSVVDSMRDMGSSGNNLMRGVGDRLGR